MQTLSTIRPTLDSTLSLWVSRNTITTTWQTRKSLSNTHRKIWRCATAALPWSVMTAKKPDAIA